MRKLFFSAACLSLITFTGCTNFGTKYSPDKQHEVYYKGEGVDESNAKKLYDYLKDEHYFTEGHEASVQITKEKETFVVNFVYDKSQVDDDRVATFKVFGAAIDKEVFNGAPMKIKLCDKNMETFKDIGLITPTEQ